MITENKERKKAWMVKNAENISTGIRVDFFPTYEDAYAFMEEEAKNKDGELSITEIGASVYQMSGDFEYWEIEEVDLSNIYHERRISDDKLDQYQKSTCISMPFSKLKLIIADITDGLKDIICRESGLTFCDAEKADDTDTYWNRTLKETLSEYFREDVLSVHASNDQPETIWIIFKEVEGDEYE